MKEGLKLGLEQEVTRVVTRDLCVATASGLPPVLATAEMVRMMEYAALLVLAPHYDEGEASVGSHVSVRHVAPAPIGMKVRAMARLTRIDGRHFSFDVAAFDETELLGDGTHERVVVDVQRLRRRAEEKVK